MRFYVHNLIAHPVLAIAEALSSLIGRRWPNDLADRLHDATIPEGEPEGVWCPWHEVRLDFNGRVVTGCPACRLDLYASRTRPPAQEDL